MALEQSIMRSAKSTRRIIVKTISQEYVLEWALVSHEVLSIANTVRNITRADKGGNNEMTVHHQFKRPAISQMNNSVTKLALYIEEMRNPYLVDQNDLKLKKFKRF